MAGTPVSCSLVLAAAEGIVVTKTRTVLAENVDHIKGKALYVLKQMVYIKQKASIQIIKLSNEQFEQRCRKNVIAGDLRLSES